MSESPAKRVYVKRGVIKRGELSHLSPAEKSREYKRLVGRVDKHCPVCDVVVNRSCYSTHCKTKKHLLAKENAELKKMLLDSEKLAQHSKAVATGSAS